jgi:hypothetical protein
MILSSLLSEVRIQTAAVPSTLEGATARGVLWQAAPGRFLLDVPGIARYLVADGCSITVEPTAQQTARNVTRFLQMTPLAALFFQRGIPVFHAAAAATPHGVVLLAGDSGAGKSTLLAALLRRGWSLVADDLAVVSVDQNGTPSVLPAFPEVVLWQDAIDKLGMTPGLPFGNNRNRQVLSLEKQFTSSPQNLLAIYWLSVHTAMEIQVRNLEGAERFSALGTLSYNSHIADALLDRSAYFRCASAIAQAVPVRQLRRPRGRWSAEELADRVGGNWP